MAARDRDDREARATERVRGADPAGRRVLVVDDDPDLRRALASGLRRAGHAVGTAADGFEAVTAAVRAQWDMILLDLRMPYRNGVEVLRLLRTRADTGSIPVCVLTTAGDESFTERAMREGASGTLDKSETDAATLVLRVDEILRALPTADERVPEGRAETLAEPATESLGRARGGTAHGVHEDPGRAAMDTVRAAVAATSDRIDNAAWGHAPVAVEGPSRRSSQTGSRTGSRTSVHGEPAAPAQGGLHGGLHGNLHGIAGRAGPRRTGSGPALRGRASRGLPAVPSEVSEIARRLKGMKSETADELDGPPTAAIETPTLAAARAAAAAAAARAPAPPAPTPPRPVPPVSSAPPSSAQPAPPPPVRPGARPRGPGRDLSMGILEAAMMAAHDPVPAAEEPATEPLGAVPSPAAEDDPSADPAPRSPRIVRYRLPTGVEENKLRRSGAARVSHTAPRPPTPVPPVRPPALVSPARAAPTPAPAAPATHAAPRAPTARPNVVHLPLGGDLAALARAVGLHGEAACVLCGARLTLQLEADARVERGVRGRFACPDCPPDRV